MIVWFFSALSGLLYFFGFVGSWHPAFAWIALIPLLWALRDAAPRKGLLLGWIAGAIAHLLGFSWILHTLVYFGELPWIVALLLHLLLSLFQSFQFAFFSWLAVVIRQKRRLSWFLVTPIAWVVSEFLWPQIFPSYFANSQFGVLPLVQILDITGVFGLSALIALINGAVVDLIEQMRRARRIAWSPLAVAIISVAAAIIYGLVRIPQIDRIQEQAKTIVVGVVQGNIGADAKFEDPMAALEKYRSLSQPLIARGAELIIWPEVALESLILPTTATALLPHVLEGITAPLLTGVIAEDGGGEKIRRYNSSALIDAERKIVGRYHKQKLLFFGDYVPLGEKFPILYDLFPNTGDFVPGKSNAPIAWGNIGLGVSICYEDILPRFIRRTMRYEPQLLVNLTNDSWFGPSREPLIHLALGSFRAIEHRRALVRATNTGISAVVDPVGRIVAQTPIFEEATLLASVPLLHGRTVYGIVGDWVGWGALLMTFVLLIRRKR